jgi:hypothetical protein
MTNPGRRLDPAAFDALPELVRDDDGLWVLEELSYMWREAQREASLAYCHWRRLRDRVAYASYRAAQDRADAAQDALGARHAASPVGRRGPATPSLRPASPPRA